MPDELEFGEQQSDPGYGVRFGGERRGNDRRHGTRAKPGRRHGERRRAGLRTLLLAAAALATSHSVRTQTAPMKPNVSVSMDDFPGGQCGPGLRRSHSGSG